MDVWVIENLAKELGEGSKGAPYEVDGILMAMLAYQFATAATLPKDPSVFIGK